MRHLLLTAAALAALAALAAPAAAAAASTDGVCAGAGTCVRVSADPHGPGVCVTVTQTAIPAVIAPVCAP